MRRLLASSLTIAVLLFVTTFAGMSVFGMEMTMDMGPHDCAGAMCAATGAGHDAGASGLDCLNHCLAAAAVPMTTAIPLAAVFALIFFAVLAGERLAVVTRARGFSFRWREGIGKHLLHQRLATVILRN